MCNKKQFKYCPSEIDECIKTLISSMKMVLSSRIKVVACCCGHGVYPMTIIVKDAQEVVWDLVSKSIIPRKRNFYKKDKQGIYYIPETLKE